jgi:anti-anti-sigma factor
VPDARHFHLIVEESEATLRLRAAGELDFAVVGRVENALDRAFSAATSRRIVFDLRRVTFLDAAGLGTILRANERARAAAFELVVVRPLGTANRVFTLTRAGQELNLVDARGADGRRASATSTPYRLLGPPLDRRPRAESPERSTTYRV